MLVVVADRGEQVGDMVVIQRVVGVAARSARANQPQAAKDPQVVRGRAGTELRRFRQLLHGALGADELGEHPQATGGGQRLQGLGELLCLQSRTYEHVCS